MHKFRVFLQHCGVDIRKYKGNTLRTQVVTLYPKTQRRRGYALLAYLVKPFLLKDRSQVPATHTNLIESLLMADVLLKLGYEVDVIDFENSTFMPEKKYDLLISSRKYFHIYANLVGSQCLKIAHLDVSHWLYNNSVSLARCYDVFKKRGVSLDSYRFIEPNWAIENADFATMLGNEHSMATYQYAGKQIYAIPVPVYSNYPEPRKEVDRIRKNFIWFGSRGLVQKGLDLVLEAFADMPEYSLKVCGQLDMEPHFKQAYHRELYELPNIRALGWVDVTSETFLRLANDTIALIYPSCAEGQSGAVVTCMHAGIIPVATKQSGVDISPEYGRYLHDISVGSIRNSVREIAESPADELEALSRNAWAYAHKNHSRDRYMRRFEEVLCMALNVDKPPEEAGPLLATAES